VLRALRIADKRRRLLSQADAIHLNLDPAFKTEPIGVSREPLDKLRVADRKAAPGLSAHGHVVEILKHRDEAARRIANRARQRASSGCRDRRSEFGPCDLDSGGLAAEHGDQIWESESLKRTRFS
jgi:hypothetical protein